MEEEVKYYDGELTGDISVIENISTGLRGFCKEYIQEYNDDRFDPMAIRVLLGNEIIVTVYAVDKMHQYGDEVEGGKIPVKKFKLECVPPQSLLKYFDSLNLTVSTGEYPIEDMRVINK